jgi:hypothetical protein
MIWGHTGRHSGFSECPEETGVLFKAVLEIDGIQLM